MIFQTFTICKIILFMVFLIQSGYARTDCPQIVQTNVANESIPLGEPAKGALNSGGYDTSKIRYYVLTPSSYPKFVNPQGEVINWSSLGCKGKPILFNCPGWQTYGLFPIYVDIIRTFVRQYNGCAVASDYSEASYNPNYFGSVSQTGNIAKAAAEYIENNICKMTNCKKNLQLHGVSWGSHVCGVTGYLLGQRGNKPLRMISSDAAGPYFNALPQKDISKRLSTASATTVINIKTSTLLGSSLANWAHQTQYIGLCGTAQDQCPGRGVLSSELCDHGASAYVTKSTLNMDYPLIKVRKCSSCPYKTSLSKPSKDQCTKEEDNLGWRSKGKPGLFVIKTLPECLNVTLS